MPFCPECRSEYRLGILKCAHCDVFLVAELPEAPPETTLEGARQYIESHTPLTIMVAALEPCREVRDQLLADGVPCLIAETAEGEATDVPAIFQRFNVVVAEEDLGRVKELLSGRFDEMVQAEGGSVGSIEVSLEQGAEVTCPACGATFTLEGEECPDCGLFIGAV